MYLIVFCVCPIVSPFALAPLFVFGGGIHFIVLLISFLSLLYTQLVAHCPFSALDCSKEDINAFTMCMYT